MLFNLKSVEELTAFLVSKKITATQAYFCHLIYQQDMSSFYRYVHEFQQFTTTEIEDLEDRGYIVNQDYHSKTKFNDMYVVTERLLDGLTLLDDSLGVAFWNTYPSFITVQNQKVPAKSCDREELIRDYTRGVIKDEADHQRIMLILDYAKKRNMVTMGIRKWVDSRQWEMVEQEMKENNNQPGYGDVEFH